MKTFSASTTINAPAATVWRILTDAPAYTSWNSTVDRVEGEIALGSKVTVHAKINPGRAFPVKVAELSEPSRMVWRGGMPLGLFKGVRTFTISPKDDGQVEFSMHEVFSGPMSPLIGRSIPDLQPAFDDFAADLKRAAEAG